MSLIPDGKYVGIPTGGELGETSKGNDQVGISFDLPEIEASLNWYGYFTEKTERRTIETLLICGWDGRDLADLSSIGTDPSVRVQLVVETDQDDKGEPRNVIRWVNRPGGVAILKPLDAGRKAALAARMKGLIIEVSKSAGTAAARSTAPIPPRQTGNGSKPAVDTNKEPDWMREGPGEGFPEI